MITDISTANPAAAAVGGLTSYAKATEAAVQLVQPQTLTNSYDIHCSMCRSLVLKRGVAKKQPSDSAVQLPLPAATQDPSTSTYPLVPGYLWVVNDMMAFENVGFTKAVPGGDDTRYLSCADCDTGPIGYHPARVPKAFLIAADRVRYNVV
ncbi:Mss4-like protein [Powellomyces hirtus]|nr:Mss4-like protein [Powellomyces hirtus]